MAHCSQGNGSLTQLLRHLREEFPDFGIYVESVLNERLRPWLLKNGFECTLSSDVAPCYFRKPHTDFT